MKAADPLRLLGIHAKARAAKARQKGPAAAFGARRRLQRVRGTNEAAGLLSRLEPGTPAVWSRRSAPPLRASDHVNGATLRSIQTLTIVVGPLYSAEMPL